MVSFAVQKLLSLARPHLFIFAFVSFALGDRSQKMMLWFRSKSVQPMFSYSAPECLSKENEKTDLKIYMHPNVSVLSRSIAPDSFATPWTTACQAPLSMGFCRQEYWSGLHALLQGIFPTKGLDPGLPHCRHILYHLSHQGGPRMLEWVAYPFSRASFRPRN